MINTIVVAVDGSEHAAKALDLAADLAGKYGARVVLLHVLMRDAAPGDLKRVVDLDALTKEVRAEIERLEKIPVEASMVGGAYAGLSVPVPEDILQAVGGRIVEDARKAVAAKGVDTISTIMISGDPAKRILETARNENADMIVMGSRGFGDLRGLLVGSVSHKVSHLAECTCVTVK